MNTDLIKKKFNNLKVSQAWCFKNVRSTEQWTHGYHTYPAKFLPNIVKKLIEDFTSQSDLIVDIFAGCGTTLVEAKLHGRKSIGIDINPVANLITSAKINPINPEILKRYINAYISSLDTGNIKKNKNVLLHDRIFYWFNEEEIIKINFLIREVEKIKNKEIKTFIFCGISNVLKKSSKWLQSSIKPQIDPIKKPKDPFELIKVQLIKMMKKNEEYYNELNLKGFLETESKIYTRDAKKTLIKPNSVDVIITSPPYVTSYEYADIHQLSAYWLKYIEDIKIFRKNFIGTFYSGNLNLTSDSTIANSITARLNNKNKKLSQEVAKYFQDMNLALKESYRILKKEGKLIIVIGNTKFKNVKILTAEVILEILLNNKFEIVKLIKRSIPYKLIPSIRDKKTGKFVTKSHKNKKFIYPDEYIIIAKKTANGS